MESSVTSGVSLAWNTIVQDGNAFSEYVSKIVKKLQENDDQASEQLLALIELMKKSTHLEDLLKPKFDILNSFVVCVALNSLTLL